MKPHDQRVLTPEACRIIPPTLANLDKSMAAIEGDSGPIGWPDLEQHLFNLTLTRQCQDAAEQPPAEPQSLIAGIHTEIENMRFARSHGCNAVGT